MFKTRGECDLDECITTVLGVPGWQRFLAVAIFVIISGYRILGGNIIYLQGLLLKVLILCMWYQLGMQARHARTCLQM